MPPKFPSRAKRNHFSNQTGKQEKKQNRPSLTFLLIGNNKVGIDVAYKLINSDEKLREIIKEHEGSWDRDERMWVLSHKNYQKVLDKIVEHCKNKQYYCSRIPSFVYDAQSQMPTDLPIKISKNKAPPVIQYLDIEKWIDSEALPFYDKLYDFQKQSLKFGIQHHGRMLLADEMGVGKTIQSLAIAFIYRYDWPMVIICPSTLRFNWLNEVTQWYGQFIKKNQIYVYSKGGLTLKQTTKILIISYELAWKFKQIWSDFKVAIVDEAHYLKNSGCKRTDILVPQLAKKKRIILLTGTPAFARPREIFNLASIIRPDAYNNFIQFGNRYCDPSRNPWSGAVEYNGCVNSKQLFYLLKDRVMLRRLKKDVLTQLPDKLRQKIAIETNKSITREIQKLIEQNGSERDSQNMIMQMFGFRNAEGDTAGEVNRKRQSLMEAYRLSGVAKLEGVVEYILSLLQNDVKLLIFAHHRVMLDKIQSELVSKKYKFIRIDGEVEMSERQYRVNQFQTNKNVMAALLSISAAGVGLTLTASSTVVFAELHWTPGMLIQAEDRAHRIGQKNCVNCHYLIGQGTLDPMLYSYLLRKINNVSTFVDGAQQRLQMEEMAKGQIGKVSKSALSGTKHNSQREGEGRRSFGITPIRRVINMNVSVGTSDNNSQVSDISSHFSDNALKTGDDEGTASLKSRRRLPDRIYCQQLLESQNVQSVQKARKQIKGECLQKFMLAVPENSSKQSDHILPNNHGSQRKQIGEVEEPKNQANPDGDCSSDTDIEATPTF